MRRGSPRQLSHGRHDRWDAGGVLLEASLLSARLDLTKVFGNARPVELEVGTGKGGFLLARAAARPELNFLGLEVARAYCHYAADRIRRRELANVRMLCAEAGHVLRVCLPDASIWRVHVYFPDPWPKRRHRRRRLLTPSFVGEVGRVLRPGGQLLVVTDHLGYFIQIRRVMDGLPGFAAIAFPRMTGEEGELVGTNFERKYVQAGRPFYAMARLRYVQPRRA